MILNRMLGMELKVQRNIFQIADALVQPESPPPNACLVKYANDRSGSAVLATIAGIHHCSFGNNVQGACVIMKYNVQRPPLPAAECRFWRHAHSGRTCWLDTTTSTMIFSDCSQIKVPSCDAHVLRMRDYFPCQHKDWLQQVVRHEQTAARRASKLTTRFHLATVNAMRMWDESTHRVLRVHPTDAFPQGLVGLLVRMS